MDILAIYVLLVIRCSEEWDRTRLSILGLLPVSYSADHRNLTAGVLPAVHLALEHLYRHSWILKNYELKVVFKDTQVWLYTYCSLCTLLVYDHTHIHFLLHFQSSMSWGIPLYGKATLVLAECGFFPEFAC